MTRLRGFGVSTRRNRGYKKRKEFPIEKDNKTSHLSYFHHAAFHMDSDFAKDFGRNLVQIEAQFGKVRIDVQGLLRIRDRQGREKVGIGDRDHPI